MKYEEDIYTIIAELKREEVKNREGILSIIKELKAYIQMKLESMYAEMSQLLNHNPELVALYIPVKLHADLARWQRSCGIKEYDQNQPRNPDTGEWTSGNVDDSNDNSIDKLQSVDKFSTSKKGVEFVKRSEGFRSQQYLDASKRPTIGYGHLLRRDEGYPNGISQDEVLKLLEQDVEKAENTIKRNVKVELSQHKFDALTSFIYNIGGFKFKESTMLKRLNEGKYKKVADEFPKWNKVTVNGIKVPNEGLSKRRARERKLFLRGKYE